MQKDDLVILAMTPNALGADYLIGRLVPRDDGQFSAHWVGQDGDRDKAIEQAQSAAGEHHAIFWIDQGDPAFFEALYKLPPCPKCGIRTMSYDIVRFENGATKRNCHACEHVIEFAINQP